MTNWCKPFQIKPQTIIAWTRYATNYFFNNDYGIAMFQWIFLNCKTMSIQWWWASLNFPHTIPTHTLLNLQSLKSQNKCLIILPTIRLNSPTSIFEPTKPLDVVLTFDRKKFTRSCMCESPSNLGAMSAIHFVDPKTSWPSKLSILVVKQDSLVYLVTRLAICDRSLDFFACRSLNSSILGPFLPLPPFKYTL